MWFGPNLLEKTHLLDIKIGFEVLTGQIWTLLCRQCMHDDGNVYFSLTLQGIGLVIQEKVVSTFLLLDILDRIHLVDSWSEVVWISSEGDLQLS